MKLHFYMHWIVVESATFVANEDKLYTFFCCCRSWYKYKYCAAKEEVIKIKSAPFSPAHTFALRSVFRSFHVLCWKGRSPSLVVFFGGTSCECWSDTPSAQCSSSKYANPLEASLLCSFYTAAVSSCSELSHLVKTLSQLSSSVPLNKPHALIDWKDSGIPFDWLV